MTVTVRITLNSPTPGFLQVLAHQGCWIYPAEMVTHYGKEVPWHPVGTGPFRLKSFKRGTSLILERNERYWGSDELGNTLPFLDAVRYTFEKDKNVELEGFEKGHLAPWSASCRLNVRGAGHLRRWSLPGAVHRRACPFSSMDSTDGRHLSGARVRKAFSMAIDRQTFVDSVLNGLGGRRGAWRGATGFEDYPYDSSPRTAYDPDGAESLLADAGYPDGRAPSVSCR